MAQDLGDLGERGSASQHRCRRCMAQPMAATLYTGTSKDTPGNRNDRR